MTIHMRRQTVAERRELGKSLRKRAPRTNHAQWSPESARPNPIDLLEEQNQGRLDFLVPVRRGRMMASPFAFYRGGARIMAADLAATPNKGLMVQACGDAHLANFGLFASPERRLVFDLNDFDETLEGPWECDLKRLVASVTIAARHNELDHDQSRQANERVTQSYREAMHDFAAMRTTDIWYALINEEDYVAYADCESTEKRARKTIAKAKTKQSRQALDRLAEEIDGEYRIKAEPPLLVPLREITQKLNHAANDIFLGWTHTPEKRHDYYWRQLRDWKGSVDVENLDAADLNSYARLCGRTLARAHARSGDPIAIAGYLGSSDTFDQALTEFAERYADQNERDYEAFLQEIRSGRLEAATGAS